MTDTNALGHALIEAHGYYVATEARPGNAQSEEWYILVGPDGDEYDSPREDHFIARVYRECGGDLWYAPRDAGDALALWFSLDHGWGGNHYMMHKVGNVYIAQNGNRDLTARGATPAEALAKLALAALKAVVDD